jgi:hypothetical protein
MKKQIFHRELLLALVIVVVIFSLILIYVFQKTNSEDVFNGFSQGSCINFPKTYTLKDIIIYEYMETKHSYSSLSVDGNGSVNFFKHQDGLPITSKSGNINEKEVDDLIKDFKGEFFCMNETYGSYYGRGNSAWYARYITIKVGNETKAVQSFYHESPTEFNYIANKLGNVTENMTSAEVSNVCYAMYNELSKSNMSDIWGTPFDVSFCTMFTE